jgi:hypothetical protein
MRQTRMKLGSPTNRKRRSRAHHTNRVFRRMAGVLLNPESLPAGGQEARAQPL